MTMPGAAGLSAAEPAASRRELDQLRDRVEALDSHGTRGAGVIASRVDDLVKGMAELRTSALVWQERHESQHKRDEQERIRGRRWLVTVVISVLVLLVAIIALLVQIDTARR